MTDLRLAWNNRLGAGDICVVGADLQAEEGLDTAILISLFTDARVREDELPPGHTWRRGWWGDGVEDEPDITGSKLWLLRREKATGEVLVRARAYCREALQWMIRDGVAVAVNVDTNYSAPGVMQIFVSIVEPDRTRQEFQFTDVLNGWRLMPYDRPTLAELDEQLRADVVSRLPGTDPLLRRSYIGALARMAAGGVHELYGFIGWIADQAFPDTAESAELLRWAAIWGISPVSATQAEGAILVEGTAGTVVPALTLWRSGAAVDYQTLAEFVMPAAETGNIDVEAVLSAAAGNAPVGVVLSLVSPIAGLVSASRTSRQRWPVVRTSSPTPRCGRVCCCESRVRLGVARRKITCSGRKPVTRT